MVAADHSDIAGVRIAPSESDLATCFTDGIHMILPSSSEHSQADLLTKCSGTPWYLTMLAGCSYGVAVMALTHPCESVQNEASNRAITRLTVKIDLHAV